MADTGGLGNLPRRMLVVSGSEKGREALGKLLSGSAYRLAGTAASGGEARRLLVSSSFDGVVINAPLSDEFGQELAVYAAEEGAGVLLLVKNELASQVEAQVEGSGVLTLGKPLSRELLSQAFSLMLAFRAYLGKLEEENRRLRGKLEEARLTCRAKCLLVERQGMTEAEAHRFLEKRAMDSRSALKAVAKEIISLYG